MVQLTYPLHSENFFAYRDLPAKLDRPENGIIAKGFSNFFFNFLKTSDKEQLIMVPFTGRSNLAGRSLENGK
jgi:hypothetical protein